MTVIVYSSKSGSSRRYAETLASRTGLDVFPAGGQPDGEPIIFIGWLRFDRIVGLSYVDRSGIVAAGAVGLDDPSSVSEAYLAERNDLNVPVFYLRGWIDRSKLNVIDRACLFYAGVMMKLRGLDSRTEPVFHVMMEGGSFYEDSYLEPMELFVRLGNRESMVVPSGFEPESPAPKAGMIDRYTTGLWTAPGFPIIT